MSTCEESFLEPTKSEDWEVTTRVEQRRGSMKWTIESWKAGEILESPTFNCFSIDWALEFHPGNAFYLKSLSLKGKIKINCKMCLKDENDLDHYVAEDNMVFNDENLKSNICFDFESVTDEDWFSITNNSLTVFCELNVKKAVIHGQLKAVDKRTICEGDEGANSVPVPALPHSTKSLGVLVNDLETMLKNRKNCDVTLQVGSDGIPAHKCILAARSPVFAAMFDHDMKESHSSVVTITDIRSTVVNDLLQYIYCGNISDMSNEKAICLYSAADKYAVLELKLQCADILKKAISIDNVCDVALLADSHNDEAIMNCIKVFVLKNPSLLFTERWKRLVEQNPLLAYEITAFAFEAKAK